MVKREGGKKREEKKKKKQWGSFSFISVQFKLVEVVGHTAVVYIMLFHVYSTHTHTHTHTIRAKLGLHIMIIRKKTGATEPFA